MGLGRGTEKPGSVYRGQHRAMNALLPIALPNDCPNRRAASILAEYLFRRHQGQGIALHYDPALLHGPGLGRMNRNVEPRDERVVFNVISARVSANKSRVLPWTGRRYHNDHAAAYVEEAEAEGVRSIE